MTICVFALLAYNYMHIVRLVIVSHSTLNKMYLAFLSYILLNNITATWKHGHREYGLDTNGICVGYTQALVH